MLSQPFERIVDVGGERAQSIDVTWLPNVLAVGLGAHRYGDHGDERPVRLLAVESIHCAQGTGAEREDHVVHRRADVVDLIALTSAARASAVAYDRRAVMAALNDVRGAVNGAGGGWPRRASLVLRRSASAAPWCGSALGRLEPVA